MRSEQIVLNLVLSLVNDCVQNCDRIPRVFKMHIIANLRRGNIAVFQRPKNQFVVDFKIGNCVMALV